MQKPIEGGLSEWYFSQVDTMGAIDEKLHGNTFENVYASRLGY
jgi:hypothetical protein